MNLSWAEISGLYLLAACQASQVLALGCVYHNLSATTLGTIITGYALARSAWAALLWKRGVWPDAVQTKE